eukprot:scaffold4264_cov116-Isochrysis_galbana.AAC.11
MLSTTPSYGMNHFPSRFSTHSLNVSWPSLLPPPPMRARCPPCTLAHIAQMVPSMSDPLEPTAAELAGEDPAVSEMDTTQEGGQVNRPQGTHTHQPEGTHIKTEGQHTKATASQPFSHTPLRKTTSAVTVHRRPKTKTLLIRRNTITAL